MLGANIKIETDEHMITHIFVDGMDLSNCVTGFKFSQDAETRVPVLKLDLVVNKASIDALCDTRIKIPDDLSAKIYDQERLKAEKHLARLRAEKEQDELENAKAEYLRKL